MSQRAGQGEQDALLFRSVASEATAETYAMLWKEAAEAKGFREVNNGAERAQVA